MPCRSLAEKKDEQKTAFHPKATGEGNDGNTLVGWMQIVLLNTIDRNYRYPQYQVSECM